MPEPHVFVVNKWHRSSDLCWYPGCRKPREDPIHIASDNGGSVIGSEPEK